MSVSATHGRKRLSIVVPVFNEERRLPRLLSALERDADRLVAGAGAELLEVLVVDDGSDDRTVALVEEAKSLDGRIRVVRLGAHRGKGAAIRAGMLAASGEWALMSDVDLSTPLEDTVRLAEALNDGYDVAIGSRALPASAVVVHQPFYREFAGKAFNRLLRLVTRLPLRDTQCGFKLFDLERTRVLFELQRVDGFAFDAELCMNARRLGLRLTEVPVRWANDADTRVRLVTAGMEMTLDLVRIAWSARRPLPTELAARSSDAVA